MDLLPRRALLAIASVVDIALYVGLRPIPAKMLAERHRLAPRHFEAMLQALVQANILKGLRGPRGGYELARARGEITLADIVRTALTLSKAQASEMGESSSLVEKVTQLSVRKAGQSFLTNLDTITVDDLCKEALAARTLEDLRG